MPRSPLTTWQLERMHDECVEDRFHGQPMCEWCTLVERMDDEEPMPWWVKVVLVLMVGLVLAIGFLQAGAMY